MGEINDSLLDKDSSSSSSGQTTPEATTAVPVPTPTPQNSVLGSASGAEGSMSDILTPNELSSDDSWSIVSSNAESHSILYDEVVSTDDDQRQDAVETVSRHRSNSNDSEESIHSGSSLKNLAQREVRGSVSTLKDVCCNDSFSFSVPRINIDNGTATPAASPDDDTKNAVALEPLPTLPAKETNSLLTTLEHLKLWHYLVIFGIVLSVWVERSQFPEVPGIFKSEPIDCDQLKVTLKNDLEKCFLNSEGISCIKRYLESRTAAEKACPLDFQESSYLSKQMTHVVEPESVLQSISQYYSDSVQPQLTGLITSLTSYHYKEKSLFTLNALKRYSGSAYSVVKEKAGVCGPSLMDNIKSLSELRHPVREMSSSLAQFTGRQLRNVNQSFVGPSWNSLRAFYQDQVTPLSLEWYQKVTSYDYKQLSDNMLKKMKPLGGTRPWQSASRGAYVVYSSISDKLAPLRSINTVDAAKTQLQNASLKLWTPLRSSFVEVQGNEHVKNAQDKALLFFRKFYEAAVDDSNRELFKEKTSTLFKKAHVGTQHLWNLSKAPSGKVAEKSKSLYNSLSSLVSGNEDCEDALLAKVQETTKKVYDGLNCKGKSASQSAASSMERLYKMIAGER